MSLWSMQCECGSEGSRRLCPCPPCLAPGHRAQQQGLLQGRLRRRLEPHCHILAVGHWLLVCLPCHPAGSRCLGRRLHGCGCLCANLGRCTHSSMQPLHKLLLLLLCLLLPVARGCSQVSQWWRQAQLGLGPLVLQPRHRPGQLVAPGIQLLLLQLQQALQQLACSSVAGWEQQHGSEALQHAGAELPQPPAQAAPKQQARSVASWQLVTRSARLTQHVPHKLVGRGRGSRQLAASQRVLLPFHLSLCCRLHFLLLLLRSRRSCRFGSSLPLLVPLLLPPLLLLLPPLQQLPLQLLLGLQGRLLHGVRLAGLSANQEGRARGGIAACSWALPCLSLLRGWLWQLRSSHVVVRLAHEKRRRRLLRLCFPRRPLRKQQLKSTRVMLLLLLLRGRLCRRGGLLQGAGLLHEQVKGARAFPPFRHLPLCLLQWGLDLHGLALLRLLLDAAALCGGVLSRATCLA